MILAVIGVPIVVIILTLDVAGLACYLKLAARPYSRTWCTRFVHGAATLRRACYLLFLLLALAAFLLLFPLLLGWSNHHAMALWGGIDLLSALLLYGLWKWTGKLIRLAMLHAA